MRIVLVNWAKVWDGASYGGGVNGYCQSLALSLVQRGHEVISLFGGTTFVPMPTPDKTSPCFIRRHDDWLGVRVFEVINSPVMAPSIVQYQRPQDEMSCPELENEVSRLFGLLKPDVVHFHNIEGFSIGCVDAARKAGAKVVFSLHNYHTVCTQVYLMQGHKRVCYDFDNGHNCTNCIKTKAPALERADRARRHKQALREQATDPVAHLARDLRGEWGGLKHEFSWPIRVLRRSKRMLQLYREIREGREGTDALSKIPGHAVDSVESATRPMPVPSPKKLPSPPDEPPKRPVSHDYRGQTQGILDEIHWKPETVDLSKPERRVLLNVIQPEPPSNKPLNDYGKRRGAMVQMLNSCDQVLAVSTFVREKFISMGVKPEAIRSLAIGSRINQMVQRNSELVFDPPPFVRPATPGSTPGGLPQIRPIRLAFMGYNNLYKGLHVFADALELLTPEYLRQIELSIYALDGHSIEWRFRRAEPRLAKLTFGHGYQYQDIPWMLGGKDIGVVPSVWWDNAPQTVFEFFGCGVPVLGAAVGGIPDFVKDGVNGVLFQGNNPWDLARKLAGLIREPWRLTEMRQNVHPPKDIGVHVGELEELYTSLK